MTDKHDDPLAGVEANGFCSFCDMTWRKPGCKHPKTRLLPEPAVRKVMVEWLRERAWPFVLSRSVEHDDRVRWDPIKELADRLERGGKS